MSLAINFFLLTINWPVIQCTIYSYTYKDIGTLFVHRELQLHMQEQQKFKTLCEGVQNWLALFQMSLSEVSMQL